MVTRLLLSSLVLLTASSSALSQETPAPAANAPAASAPAPQQGPMPLTEHRYKLHLGDQLTVHFPLSPEFDQQATIQPDGYVDLTMGGQAKLVGLTLPEATKVLNDHAMVRLRNPNIELVLTDFQHPYFVVAGEVQAPNRYELRQDLSALQGLMMAGGTRISGKTSQVYVIHGIDTGHPTITVLDMKHLTKAIAMEPKLASGDIIFVPRSKITNLQNVLSIVTPMAAYAAPAAEIAVNP